MKTTSSRLILKNFDSINLHIHVRQEVLKDAYNEEEIYSEEVIKMRCI